MGGIVGEALRLIFMEILVKRKGVKLNPISMMYYVSPCRHVALSLTSKMCFLVYFLPSFHVYISSLEKFFCPCEQNLGSVCSAVCLFVPWIFFQMPKMTSWTFRPFLLTLNSLSTFALNLSVFLVIQHTSALTIRVAGVVKDWVVVLLSAILFANTKLSMVNLFGYAIGNPRLVLESEK